MAAENLEEIFIGKIKNNGSPEVVYGKPGQYAIFHTINGATSPILGINFEHMQGYLRGAVYGKDKNTITIYHGITEEGRNGYYPKVKYNFLSPDEIGKLLQIDNLKDFFREV
ncbi:MAG: hypothetical protein QT11_C0001G0317 [archaeon GW2011_AR20]|nr:MAG: hypothetical protein QT11_C0001G0317 [archaeon GW2011_AR20]AQS27993.1 hypothetical protein [uncultured archaeon]AQS28485.1 hypothetical protein [uncultured archaeon]MBS3160325.1 hypothetical protein [Candidatus Woesearchaeota archaeon]